MRDAIDNTDAVEDKLTKNDLAIIHSSPSWVPSAVTNSLLSKAGQRYAQALSAYSLAKLRESGAAISVGEFTKEQLAARQLSDDPETPQRDDGEGVAEGFASGQVVATKTSSVSRMNRSRKASRRGRRRRKVEGTEDRSSPRLTSALSQRDDV
jgi:hypothetical protein